MAEVDLNPEMPEKITKEFIRRGTAVESKQKAWMYQKYAYINIKTTGKTQTALCPLQWEIGSAPAGSHMNLYGSEGGIRKILPILTSVKMVNDGGQDYTDSYIWTIEFSFKVFSLSDLDKAEESFFKVGAEVAFDFGWMGTDIVPGINQSDKKMLANVFNFDFSIEADGGFNCNVKCMSPNGLWSKESMGDIEKVQDLTADPQIRHASYLDALKTACKTAFTETDGRAGEYIHMAAQNDLEYREGQIKSGNIVWAAPFWVSHVVAKHGWFNDDEQHFMYTTLGTLITYINHQLKTSKSPFQYHIAEDDAGKIHPIYEIASSDPTKMVLPGEYSLYTDIPNGTDGLFESDEFDWRVSSLVDSNDADKIKSILLSIDYMNEIYLKLSDSTSGKPAGAKAPPTISQFLKKLFNDIEMMTGGLVAIKALPKKLNQGSPDHSITSIVNMRKAVPSKLIKPYEFKILSKKSITKSVSLASSFESDTLMMAGKSSINNNKSNLAALKELYPNCVPLGGTAKEEDKCADGADCSDADEKDKAAASDLAAKVERNKEREEELQELQNQSTNTQPPLTYGDSGFDPNTTQAANSNSNIQQNITTGAVNVVLDTTEAYTEEEEALLASQLDNSMLTKADLMFAKAKYVDGYTSTMIASTHDLFRSYLHQLVRTGDAAVENSQFGEVLWMLKLGVTIDGIFGIPFLAPITVDRLPKAYRTPKDKAVKAYFSIISIEHSFDGQGGWETALDTVMRIQG